MSHKTALEIHKLPDGGFMVLEPSRRDCSFYIGPLFACTEIGEALAYIKKTLNPPAAVR